MGTAASYILNIKDVTYISGTVEMSVQLGNYVAQSSQDTVDVETKLLSEITVPGYVTNEDSTWNLDCDGSITYIPYVSDAFLKSATMSDGYQYAVAHMFTTVYAGPDCNGGYLVAMCQFSNNGTDWYNATYDSQCKVMAPDGVTNHYAYLAAEFLIPGNADPVALWIRWKMTVDGDTGSGLYVLLRYSVSMDIVPRHRHVWVQTGQADNKMQAVQIDNTSLIGATPESITCAINGGTAFVIACASPSFNNSIDILGKATAMGKPLVSGINTIVFTSTTKCSVTPTATYMALPT